MRVGIIGAGNVADQYLASLLGYPDIEVRAIADLDVGRARQQAAAHGIAFAGTTAELLSLSDIELVVNLTTPAAHAEVALAVLGAGRHLWGEKPLTLNRESAAAVLVKAEAAGVAVGNAPDTILGAGIQTAQRELASGAIGDPQTVLTLMQGPGPDAWHPRPQFLFARGAGPLFDIGPYYLTTMVALLGPITTVAAAGHRMATERVIGSGPEAGTRFPVEVDTHLSVLLTFASGVTGTSVFSFDSAVRRQLFDISGTSGTMEVPVSEFSGMTRILRDGPGSPGWASIEPAGEERSRGVGVLEMARAIRAGQSPRASGQLAFHVLDVMLAVEESAASGGPVDIESSTVPVPPLDGDWSSRTRTFTALQGDR